MLKSILPLRTIPQKVFNRLVMKRVVQRILLPFGRDLRPERWIFVIGCYNSATTLVASILRKHSLIGGLPNEGAFLTDALPYPEQFGWPRMWCQCIKEVRVRPGLNGEEKAKRIKRQWSIWYPRQTPNLIEKTVSNAVRIQFLERYFEPAYFIYIVRNGYAVSKGIQNKANLGRWNSPYKRSGYPIELCAEQWRVTDEVVEQDSANIERFLQIYYEDLTEDPVGVLLTVTDFLGLPPMPNQIFQQEWAVHNVVSPISNMNPMAFTGLTEEDLDKIENTAGETLAKHGYARPSKEIISRR